MLLSDGCELPAPVQQVPCLHSGASTSGLPAPELQAQVAGRADKYTAGPSSYNEEAHSHRNGLLGRWRAEAASAPASC